MKRLLSERLYNLLSSINDVEGLTFGKLMQASGEQGFGFILAVLCLPGSLPLGTSFPFGVLTMILGLQLIFNVKYPRFPRWAMALRIKNGWILKSLLKVVEFLKFFESKTHMRWVHFQSKIGFIWAGIVIFLLGFIITLPFPFIHLLPAFILLLIALSLSLMDGLLLLITTTIGLFLVIGYTALFYLIFTNKAVDHWIHHFIQSVF